MFRLPRRTLADWTPEEGDVGAWLAAWAAGGWVPEYAHGGLDVVVNGRMVRRFAMIAMLSDAKLEPRAPLSSGPAPWPVSGRA